MHTCALGKDGAVRCWGANDHGQLGDGSTTDRCEAVVASLP
jgi:alpha-tubulin suppressor-like RCC1 family protein